MTPVGNNMPTLKEELDSANAKLSELGSKLTAFEASETKLKADLSSALANFNAEQDAHGKTKTALNDAQTALTNEQTAHKATADELATIKGQHSSADKRAAENLAAAGVTVPGKQTPAALNQSQAADAAVWERYQGASATEQAKMRRELGDKLDAAAEAFDREHEVK